MFDPTTLPMAMPATPCSAAVTDTGATVRVGFLYEGEALMLDIKIPSPAMRYRELEKLKNQSSFALEEPEKPDLDPRSITADNYEPALSRH